MLVHASTQLGFDSFEAQINGLFIASRVVCLLLVEVMSLNVLFVVFCKLFVALLLG